MTRYNIDIFRKVLQALVGRELEVKEYIDRIEKWMLRDRTGLLLIGSVGTGKSTIAKAMCRSWDDLLTIPKFFQCDIVAEWVKQDDSCRYEVACHKGLVVLDDLGTETRVWGNEIMPYIIFRRYERNLPTIITTNLSRDEICQKYGERIADRLRTYDQITLNFASLRK